MEMTKGCTQAPGAESEKPATKSVPVFVMMPLDPTLNDHVRWMLGRLKELQADGVMFDVWWGWCEPQPQRYDFKRYVDILEKCRELGLKAQAVMSLHACGGNVGDSVNVPLPQWIHDLEPTVPELFYKDGQGRVSKEYISLSCDTLAVFPSKDGTKKRTGIQCYKDYMLAFREAAKQYLESGTLVELQIGQGPCGELRYPAYPLSMGWQYPNVGCFMCYDPGMLRDMKEKLGREEPPKNVGDFNVHPDNSEFFNRTSCPLDEDDNFRSITGAKFTDWYGNALIAHGDRVMAAAIDTFPRGESHEVKVAGKVPGIHWLNAHPSHAAEVTAGLVGKYLENICAMLARHNAMLDFTCLEMETAHQTPDASSRPERLVSQAMHCANDACIDFAAENALPVHNDEGFNQIVRQVAFGLRHEDTEVRGFTFLRLETQLVEASSPLCGSFSRFVTNMHSIANFVVDKDCACAMCIVLKLPEMPDISMEKSWKPVMVSVKEDKEDSTPALSVANVETKDPQSEEEEEDDDDDVLVEAVPDLDNRADSIVVTQRPVKVKKGRKLGRTSTAS